MAVVVRSSELVDRVRAALAGRDAVREVRMFGGLAFMVDEKMVVCVRGDADLLVRADPDQADELLTHEGAGPAEMGAGRSMSKNWISVGAQALETDVALASWLGAALAYNPTSAAAPRRRR